MSDPKVISFPKPLTPSTAGTMELAVRVIDEQAAALAAHGLAIEERDAIIVMLTDKIDETAGMFQRIRDRGRIRIALWCLVLGFLAGWWLT